MPATESIESLLEKSLDRARSLSSKPNSTYRLQFHKGFTFRDATEVVPYLASLGVTHLYASPILKAQPGSTHGYDVIDHCSLNPELGTAADYDALCAALKERGISQILDTVPNHAGVATNENTWWNDALKNGPTGRYGGAFDISWTGSPRPDLHNRVLLAILGKPYDEVLTSGELKLVRDGDDVFVTYFERRFPIHESVRDISAINASPDRLDELLSKQFYRLAYWKVAPDEINYRRFFDVNDLAALAMDKESVFAETHALTLSLAARGDVTGLRIDHPDGLADPLIYFQRLQRYFVLACASRIAGDGFESVRGEVLEKLETIDLPHLYVLGEKILALDERLDTTWPIDGTTGYRFLNIINGLFVDPDGDEAFTDLYRDLTGSPTDFDKIVHEKKRLILNTTMASERTMLTERLFRIATSSRSSRDFSRRTLDVALVETIACFGVYRTYLTARGSSDEDVKRIDNAIGTAKKLNPQIDEIVFQFLRNTLLNTADPTCQEFATRFQQLTSPVMAKGVEDTAFYDYNRLVAINEVGGNPAAFGLSAQRVHEYLANRQKHWPFAMSSLSTHDTKRSEDVRARLNVLSEIPARWKQLVKSWMNLNRADHTVGPTANEEYLIYQAMVGIWPLEPTTQPTKDWIDRIQAYTLKAMREGKETTHWTDMNEPHEKSVRDFIDRICNNRDFITSLDHFVQEIAPLGLINSLAQVTLKLTAPGVPDTYQGQELWDFSLVDPDNRRPVDYALRRHAVESLQALVNAHRNDLTGVARDLSSRMNDGHAKLWLTQNVLRARRDHPKLFTQGGYFPVASSGKKAGNLFAFGRIAEDRAVLVLVPRLVSSLGGEWADTSLQLPSQFTGKNFRNLLTGQTLHGNSVGDALSHFLVAVYISE